MATQEAVELYLIKLFKDTNLCAMHRNRVRSILQYSLAGRENEGQHCETLRCSRRCWHAIIPNTSDTPANVATVSPTQVNKNHTQCGIICVH